MRTKLFFAGVLFLLGTSLFVYAAVPEMIATISTGQYPFSLMRTVTVSDTLMGNADKVWSSVKVKLYKLDPHWNTVSIGLLAYGDGSGAGDPAAGSITFKVWACRPYSAAQLVCTGTVTVGELAASHAPWNGEALSVTDYKFAEGNFTNLTETWSTDVKFAGTTDDLGTVNFDPLGAYYIYVEVTYSACTSVYVLVTGR